MKYKVLLNLLLMSSSVFFIAHDEHSKVEVVQEVVNKKKCACSPVIHVFYKKCLNNYIQQFPLAGLVENHDTEDVPENIVEALTMIVQTISYVDQDGNLIVPTLNKKGKLVLSFGQNADYVIYKEILQQVDMATTLTAEELYQEWVTQLQVQKSAQ